uniref:Uncharacterized protein n=1 Tax=Opuntia streptacantha TaxID=393608 RepID=A0A7C8YFL9_OPUST
MSRSTVSIYRLSIAIRSDFYFGPPSGRLGEDFTCFITFVQSPKTKQRKVGGIWQRIDRGNRQVAVVEQGLRQPVEEAAGVGGVGRSNRGREMRKQSKGNK